MKKWFFISFLWIGSQAFAQKKLTLIIDKMPEKHEATLFVAGNFNMWNPGDTLYTFKNKNGRPVFEKSFSEGKYEFKITRGNWQTGEEHADFSPMSNRQIDLRSDTVVHITIGAWADDRPEESKKAMHTTTDQVSIMDTAFYMPQLNRSRRIWIYLPKDYKTSGKKYPVLYMHDGQNVFDASTSYSGEWGVDEFLDSLRNSCNKAIVVAVDNGLTKRMNEYNPWEFMNFGKGEGDAYVDFLVKTLKPYIDSNYRTLPEKNNTSIAGSSMGGLISLCAVLKYPQVYGSAGIFSPAFWTASGIDSMVIATAQKVNAKLYFYAGGQETQTMVTDMMRVEAELLKISKAPVKQLVDPEAKHNEAAWRKHFPDFYKWIFCN